MTQYVEGRIVPKSIWAPSGRMIVNEPSYAMKTEMDSIERDTLPVSRTESRIDITQRIGVAMFKTRGALKSVKFCALTIAESLFPREIYARRIRRWTKQEEEISPLPVLCRRDAHSLDIGANQGLFVWHPLPISKGVVAFEPLPRMLEVLRSRYGSQIRLEGVILSDHEGHGELRYPTGNYMLATVAESKSLLRATDQEMERVTAPMKTSIVSP